MTELLAPRQDGALRSAGELTLADALDRLLERGVALEGDLVLSVADVDLVWLGLRAVVGGIEHAPPGARLERATHGRAPAMNVRSDNDHTAAPPPRSRRLPMDEDRTEHGLVQLVLAVVELLRQLMERQALRRIDDPSLSDEQIERLGSALMRLADRMEELKTFFGLHDDDLELRLGRADDVAPSGTRAST